MENDSPRGKSRKHRWNDRFNTATRDLNAVLVVVAIGLAVLDFTCFIALTARNAIPSAASARPAPAAAAASARPASAGVAATTTPAQMSIATTAPAQMSIAAISPTKPTAALTGW